MPLTPTDVANKQFRIAFRGYSLDEVDAFLDEVENELARLLRDNSDLRTRAGAAPAAAPAAAASAEPPAAAQVAPLAGMEGQEAALRTLLLAQRTADEAIAEARAEAEQMVASARSEADSTLLSARAEAEQTLSSARAEAERTLTSARAEAEQTLTSARAEAEQTLTSAHSEADSTLSSARAEAEQALTASRTRAAQLDQEVAAKIQAATGDLETRRRALESRIEELRAFEREYRTRLKAYLETQLRELDGGGAPDDSGAGVPAGARTAAVGMTPGAAAAVRGGSAPVPVPAGAGAAGGGDVPDGPPREAEPSLRAVPPLATGGGAVGPFTVVPSADDSDSAPADR